MCRREICPSIFTTRNVCKYMKCYFFYWLEWEEQLVNVDHIYGWEHGTDISTASCRSCFFGGHFGCYSARWIAQLGGMDKPRKKMSLSYKIKRPWNHQKIDRHIHLHRSISSSSSRCCCIRNCAFLHLSNR